MDLLISPIVEVVKALCVPVGKRIGYVYQLKENIEKLQTEKGKLSATSEDLKRRVQHEEAEQRVKCTNEVANWLQRVEEFDDQAGHVLQEGSDREQMKCICRWSPGNCWSAYKLGKKVYGMLENVNQLQFEGRFDAVTSNLPPPLVREMPTESTVGLDVTFSKVWKCLVEDEDAQMIGLYGMGGVGKTTLMKKINNELSHRTHDFDIVIWVVVSKSVNLERIQDSIKEYLPISNVGWKESSQHKKATELCRSLSEKKFVLLIDDVWDRLDLSEVGVPCPSSQNKSKIVFTTRSKEVCGKMAAHKSFEVRCLTLEEALKLFEQNVGRKTLNSNPEISKFAEDITKECKGLPLALVTIGRAMAERTNPRDWEYSLDVLRNVPSDFSGMKEIFYLLEFSYESLKNPALQSCFLYCYVFPEDYDIPKDYLINLWIGEGLLGEIDDVHKVRNKGENFIANLKLACLLEEVNYNWGGRDCVQMHDVIRDMAIWISCDKRQENDKILVVEDEWKLANSMFSRWKKAEKISVHGSRIESIGQPPPVTLELKTLIVRETEVTHLPLGFFISMKALTVLDLSENRNLKKLPGEIGELTDLQHLDISGTGIGELPHEFKKLTRIRCLILDTRPGLRISAELISGLSTLTLFSQWPYFWSGLPLNEREFIEALGSAKQLSDVSAHVSTLDCALLLFNHPSLRRRVRRAAICCCEDPVDIKIEFSSSRGCFSHLEELLMFACSAPVKIELPNQSMFSSLRRVDIVDCDAFIDLSWLMQTPNLQTLNIDMCEGIDKIVSGKAEEMSGIFSSLVELRLWNLRNLTRICDEALPFPSIQTISIVTCPNLRKLPLDSNSAKNTLHEIKTELDWWNKLEWDDETTKAFFTSKV